MSEENVMEAFNNRTRRKIIEMLLQHSMYQTQIVRELGIREQAVVRHLRVLEELGMVTSWTEQSPNGPARRYYSISDSFAFLRELNQEELEDDLFSIFLRDCLTGPDALKRELERLKKLEKHINRLLEALNR